MGARNIKPGLNTSEACHRLAQKLTVKRLIAAVVLTILAVLGWLYVMFWGLILTGNLMTAWILGLAYAVAVILLCAASTLRKKLTWRRVTA
jgi:hypothetical protein